MISILVIFIIFTFCCLFAPEIAMRLSKETREAYPGTFSAALIGALVAYLIIILICIAYHLVADLFIFILAIALILFALEKGV